ncbi:MAG TPA: hypothetical protein VGA37_15165 [Gemmatimonadales bacterium]
MEFVSLTQLWLPILASAAIVFVASALAWTALPHHKRDWGKLPDEEKILSGLRMHNVGPGHYMFPHTTDMAEFKSEEFQKRLSEGPVGLMIVQTANVRTNMGKPMLLSFVYYLVVAIFVAYVTGSTVGAGEEYMRVFRISGTVATIAYTAAMFPDAIWFGRQWASTWKSVVDGVVYGLLTAGVFGWLWP